MVKHQKWIIIAVVSALGLIAIYRLIPSDAARIKKQFGRLSEQIAKRPGENKLIAAANAKRIREVFTETVTIQEPGYNGTRVLAAAELPALVLRARIPYAELSLNFTDFVIDFPQQDQALVRVTAILRGVLPSGEVVEDFQELLCRLRTVEDVWRIEAVEVVTVLER
ncbi:MAG: hypothetical protein PVJ53_08255 [Desulfobacterales bacterium]